MIVAAITTPEPIRFWDVCPFCARHQSGPNMLYVPVNEKHDIEADAATG